MPTFRPLISAALRLAYRVWCKHTGFTVHSHDFSATHYTTTWADALAWAACYAPDDFVAIRHRGAYVAIRGV